jgi:nitrate reductase NapA
MSELTDRRTFLKALALGSAAAAAASLMPGIVFGEAVQGRVGEATNLTWMKTPCTFCGVGCGLLIQIENGRAVAVRGDPD